MPHILPTVNACLNATSAIFLILGWKAIREKKENAHKNFMSAALGASFLFLCFYLAYHLSGRGLTRYPGRGLSRIIYFTILLTHTPLAAVIVPFSLMAVYHAVRKDFASHTRITRWLFPVWVYVSVTGVLIYWMLYGL
ncbi:MAG: DUF420 domain-containing protein [Candidatus Omnitrophica bacterium]|nr:DUF420 domain-containing protein [Candidatus Omnitrophota bacterium]